MDSKCQSCSRINQKMNFKITALLSTRRSEFISDFIFKDPEMNSG
jgi:hypothetical protein